LEKAIEEPPSWFLGQLLSISGGTDSSLIFLILTIGVIFLLLIFSAIISGSEVAFFSLSNAELEECEGNNKGSDKLICYLVSRPNHLLATILIINNFVNVAIITIATYATWLIVGHANEGPVLAILAGIITLLIVFFGEIIPKIYANQKGLVVARLSARILYISMKIVNPLAWVLVSMTSIVEKRIKKKGYSGSIEEVNHALELSTEIGTTERERDILKGIVHFSTIPVTQIMKSRVDIEAVENGVSFHELMDKINKSGYSRLPVYKEDLDTIEGILYIKDLLPHTNRDEFFDWQKLLRPAYFVPEAKMIDTLLKDFQEKHVHIAIVVDEYGGTEGLITLEDIIEEIVGEISDEYDEEEESFKKVDASTYDFEGKTSINDFCKVVKEDARIFEEIMGESESLGGMVLEVHTRLPNTGEQVVFDKYTFTVLSVDTKRIKKIRVTVDAK
jgi:magnesium and cobalt exporter, CNNM family